MKRIFFAFLFCLGTMLSVFAQSTPSELLNNERDYLYINTFLNTKDEVNALSRNFSVDNCSLDERTGLFKVRVYLSRHEYSDFLAHNLTFEIISETVRANAPMASTVADMANWNKYPTYEVYVQMMQNFQTNFPNLCKIDTILAATPCASIILSLAELHGSGGAEFSANCLLMSTLLCFLTIPLFTLLLELSFRGKRVQSSEYRVQLI